MHLHALLGTAILLVDATSARRHIRAPKEPRQVTVTVTGSATELVNSPNAVTLTVTAGGGAGSGPETSIVTSYTTLGVPGGSEESSSSSSSSSSEISIPPVPLPSPISEPPLPWQGGGGGDTSTSSLSLPVLTPTPVAVPPASLTESTPIPLVTPTLPPNPNPPESGAAPPSTTGASEPPPVPGVANCGKGYTYCAYMLWGTHYWSQSDVDKAYCDDSPSLCSGDTYKTNTSNAVFVCLDNNPAKIQLMCACGGTCLNEASTNNIAHCDQPCINS